MNVVADQLAVDLLDEENAGIHAPHDNVTESSGENATPLKLNRRGRVSKWDRPPDPHDWRYFVGTIGKILIATGLLLFGFVGYQLWGTGIETARAQNSLENEFESRLIERSTTAAVGAPPVELRPELNSNPNQPELVGPETDIIDGGTLAVDDAPVTQVEPSSPDPANQQTPGAASDNPVAQDLSDQAVVQDLPPVVRGEAIARLEIPGINQVQYVLPGVNVDDLKKGPDHYPDTPLPGQLGNAAIAGHRTTYGAPFFDVDQLNANDEIIVTMASGDTFVYDVTFTEVVAATDYFVVATGDPTVAELTITSCHPKYTARERFVVHSVLNVEKSAQVGLPTFYDLGHDPADDISIPGDDPVLGAPAPNPDAPASGQPIADQPDRPVFEGDEPTNEGGVVVPAPIAPASPASPTDLAETRDADAPALGAGFSDRPQGAAEDAFARGWFHDMSAFPQIALWGMVLTLIAIGSYLLSRRFRHDSIGFLVGVGPFMFTLYFFFQNVNRLLPPGL